MIKAPTENKCKIGDSKTRQSEKRSDDGHYVTQCFRDG